MKWTAFKVSLWILLATALAIMGLISLASYNWREQVVTNDPAFGNFGVLVGEWRTKVPLTLYKGDFYEQSSLALIDDQWNSNWQKIIDIPVGTKIRIEHLKYKRSFERSYLWITGSLVDGDYKNEEMYLSCSLFPENVMFHYEVRRDLKPNLKPPWTVEPDKLER